MSDFDDKYFHEGYEEYPRDVCDRLLPWNVCWEYISSTFLNGFVNYVDIVSAWSLYRYEAEKDLSFGGLLGAHTQLHKTGDDVMLLGKIADGKYMYFYFDCDVSDCEIGRFETMDKHEGVVRSFDEYALQRGLRASQNCLGKEIAPVKIPLDLISGWIRF